MPEVHVYVSERDKALIAGLPPDVSVASILREALAGRRECPHDRTVRRCTRCGATLDDDPLDGPDPLDEDYPVEVESQVDDMDFRSAPPGGAMTTR